MKSRFAFYPVFLWLAAGAVSVQAAGSDFYRKAATFGETLIATREAWRAGAPPQPERSTNLFELTETLRADWPLPWDWAHQDSGGKFSRWFDADPAASEWEQRLFTSVQTQLGESAAPLRAEYKELCRTSARSTPAFWAIYVRACEQRRTARLKTIQQLAPQIVFTKGRTLQPSFFGYTEGQSDAQNERHFRPNGALCLWSFDGSTTRTWLADPGGAIRDPAVSWDGQRVVFAWKKSLDQDDYHLYELDVRSGQVRQITRGLGFADYEPAFLPGGDLVFTSTRCVQTVDCWWTEVSNLYTCDPDGGAMRRLSFDQVHALYPQVLSDGRVIYMRWDYNDRGQMYPQGLFQMNPDGTSQTEFYGNQSWFPTAIVHARGIPGTEKLLAIFTGHHTAQTGELGIIDPARGRQENAGAQLIAPVRETPAERIDYYGQDGDLFQYPYPLTETEFLVGYAPLGWHRSHRPKGGADLGIYWMDRDGHRELLITDPLLACRQPVPLLRRQPPPLRPSLVDWSQTNSTFYLQDIYAGPGLAGVPRGTVERLRVIALQYRAAGIGNNGSIGPAGEALVCTPVSIGNGSWDVKIVLGDATVYADGSAYFNVPSRTPVYFQAIDARGHAVQTMRSWSTLQPGEVAACVGCHESKNSAPPPILRTATLAAKSGPQDLQPFCGRTRGFSFIREIQPILDRHCIRCHHDRGQKMPVERLRKAITLERDPIPTLVGSPSPIPPGSVSDPASARPAVFGANTNLPAFSLLATTTVDSVAKRAWSDAYLNLTLSAPSDYYEARGAWFGVFDGRLVNWIGSQSIPTPLPPYAAGACRSQLLLLLDNGHYGIRLSREELEKFACWIDLLVPYCGDYLEANTWTSEESARYQHFVEKRAQMENIERQNIRDIVATQKTAQEP